MTSPCKLLGTAKCRCSKTQATNLTYLTSYSRHALLRKLFSDHSWYTISFMQAAVFNLPLAQVYLTRLLQNQKEIGDEMHLRFGLSKAQGEAISKLLKEHIQKAGAALTTAIETKSVTSEKTKQAATELYEQGDRLSTALAGLLHANEEEVKREFRRHNQHVLTIATYLLDPEKRQQPIYIAELDAYTNHAIHLADIIYAKASML